MRQLLVILTLFALVLVGDSRVDGQDTTTHAIELATVVNIVDGDTIDVLMSDGMTYRVRYIGINTPESDETCGSDATVANAALVDGKVVAMQRDISETDQFDRLLRYVYVEGMFVNAALVTGGWAEAVRYPPDTAFAEWFDVLYSEAHAANIGCHPTGIFTAPIPTPLVPTNSQPTSLPPQTNFVCDCSKTCTQMVSCDEAYFQLNQCGCSRRDGDGDGVPCESICPGG